MVQEEDVASFCSKGHLFHLSSHAHTIPCAQSQKGTPQKCQNPARLPPDTFSCKQEPLGWAHHVLPPHACRLATCWSTFQPLVRSTYEGLFPLPGLRTHERGVCDHSATQMARHSARGPSSPGQSCPQSHFSAEAQGTPSSGSTNTRPEQLKMIRLFDPEPKAFLRKGHHELPEKGTWKSFRLRPRLQLLALRAGVLLPPGPQEWWGSWSRPVRLEMLS